MKAIFAIVLLVMSSVFFPQPAGLAQLEEELEVSGIVAGQEPAALVNHKLVKKGDVVGKVTVLEINPQGVVFAYEEKKITVPLGTKYNLGTEKAQRNDLFSSEEEATSDTVEISINLPSELDFLTKAEILNLRRQRVFEHPELVDKDYRPSEAVFGQIQDKRPWWGMQGIFYHGAGNKSIDGPSEESRYLLNPFLLLALQEMYAYVIYEPVVSAKLAYPEPVKLIWEKNRRWAKAKFAVRDFLNFLKRYKTPDAGTNEFYLVDYNARDFGFNFLALIPEKSVNITTPMQGGKAYPLVQYIHCGGSCGYPGGCNNMSPHEEHLRIKAVSLPALAYFKLWRKQPASTSQEADLVFKIEIN
jgi:hypothetical protein